MGSGYLEVQEARCRWQAVGIWRCKRQAVHGYLEMQVASSGYLEV